MVEGLPGPDFAGLKQYPLTSKHGGGSGTVWCRGLFACIARCFIVWWVLFVAYCLGCIVQGVFLCSENVLRRYCRYFSRE